MTSMGFWSLCFLLVLPSSVTGDDEAANKTVRIGYLAWNIDYAGAINVAIQDAQNDGFMRDYNFRYNRERKCDENYKMTIFFSNLQSVILAIESSTYGITCRLVQQTLTSFRNSFIVL